MCLPHDVANSRGPMIRGILFDMDGVVVRQRLDFPAIKREIFGDTDGFILERLCSLSPPDRQRAEAILERHEAAAALAAEPMDGIIPFLAYMERRKLRRALVTRNSRRSTSTVLSRLGLCFDVVVTREDAPPKPAPDPVLLACRQMRVAPSEALFVGDFEFDMLAGRRAGVCTVLLRNDAVAASAHADLSVDSLEELQTWMEARTIGIDHDPCATVKPH